MGRQREGYYYKNFVLDLWKGTCPLSTGRQSIVFRGEVRVENLNLEDFCIEAILESVKADKVTKGESVDIEKGREG